MKSFNKFVLLPALVILSLIVAGCTSGPLEKFEETRTLMDTFITVVIYADEETGQETQPGKELLGENILRGE